MMRYYNRGLRLQADVGDILVHDESKLTIKEMEILRAAMEIGKKLARW